LATNPLYSALKQQALHDYNLVSSMAPPKSPFPDWVIIISFYMSLHCVNAHAARIGWKWKHYNRKDPFKLSRHTQALRYVRRKLGEVAFKDYNHLFGECWNARYDPFYLKNTSPLYADNLFKLAKKFLKILA